MLLLLPLTYVGQPGLLHEPDPYQQLSFRLHVPAAPQLANAQGLAV
jgi:hypothetical protein